MKKKEDDEGSTPRRKRKRKANDFQNELLRLDTHNNLVGSVNRLREERIKKNRENIDSLDADLMTTRRQVEIIQNQTFGILGETL